MPEAASGAFPVGRWENAAAVETIRLVDLPTGARPETAAIRRWLVGLDGIRGLAALFVVLNHIFLRAFPGYPANHAPF